MNSLAVWSVRRRPDLSDVALSLLFAVTEIGEHHDCRTPDPAHLSYSVHLGIIDLDRCRCLHLLYFQYDHHDPLGMQHLDHGFRHAGSK